MTVFIDMPKKDNCWNLHDGVEMCVHCGCCSEDPLKRARARLEVSERAREEWKSFNDYFEDPYWGEVQRKNVKENIKWFGRRVRYYRKRVRELEK